ncbi:MAG: pirin family protein [Flavobacteriales bacterium]|nr:pirin family protein [Flavobacteriales bacterium]
MIEIVKKKEQAIGEFNNGEIVENKPIGFPMEGGKLTAYSNLFYWAHAKATIKSTISLHPHKGFEIISVVLKGSIEHYDTLIDKWIDLEEGSLQVIQSGSGVSHAETIHKGAAIFQIWLDPNIKKTLSQKAKYKDYSSNNFPINGNKKTWIGENSPVQIEAEGVEMFQLYLENETVNMSLDTTKYYSIYVLLGNLTINTNTVEKSDFIKIYYEEKLEINTEDEVRLFCISSPKEVSYPTYKA